MNTILIEGRCNSSQDGIIVNRGGYAPALSSDTATVRRLLQLSRIRAQNVCSGGVACTLNTRYEDAAIKDYITLKHYPKTACIYIYETE